MAKFYANPYDFDAAGFYFSSFAEFKKKLKAAEKKGVEEFAIEFIDGTAAESALWKAIGTHLGYGDLELWFGELENLEDNEMAAIAFFVGNGYFDYSVEKALAYMDDIGGVTREGTVEDAACDFVQEVGIENADPDGMYFDYETFGRDLDASGEFDEDEAEHYARMSDQEAGEEYVDSIGGVDQLDKKTRELYFDYEAFARDAEINDTWNEFTFAGKTYVTEPGVI